MRLFRALYVTDRWDGPYRYRCLQACEQLRRDGATANVLHVSDPRLLQELPRYSVVVLFRLGFTEQVHAVLDLAERSGIAVLFDIDDLAFDPSLDELAPFRARYSAAEWAASYGRQVASLKTTLVACEAFIGSTMELAERARRLGKRAHVHPNVAPDHYIEAGRRFRDFRRALRPVPTIGYFSGSDTHDEDFASILPAVARFLSEHADARLLVGGYLQVSGRYPRVERRLVRLPYMHWRDFAYAYALCHVTLAPLSVKNAFTDAKSALKFFEAGAFHTPTIASPVREMVSSIEHDVTGWLASTDDDWIEYMGRAIEVAVSERVGDAARDAVEAHHSAAAVRGRLRAILENYASAASGPEPELLPLEPPDETGERSVAKKMLRPFKAAYNLKRIVSASRRRNAPEWDVELLDPLIDALRTSDAARKEAARAGVEIIALEDFSEWKTNEGVSPTGALPGERKSVGLDPQLISPRLDIRASALRFVVVRMRALTRFKVARMQVYWTFGDQREFTEAQSVAALLEADGLDGTYVMDWSDRSRGPSLKDTDRLRRIRVDPLDCPGSFRLGAILLLPDAPNLARLRGASVTPAARETLVLSGTAESVRRELAERLTGQPLEVASLGPTAEGVRAELVRARAARPVAVDVVVPVYNAGKLVERCIRSVLEHARGDYRLVIIDDASTDSELSRFLSQIASERPNVVLSRNSANLGFVKTANRGFRGAGERDVLLLNSDTEVFEGFLERLIACAHSDDHIGLVSPLSNNATILSVPLFCHRNELPEGMTARDVARLVRDSSKRLRPEIVTPHGFCLYAKAAFLADVGVFDEEHFDRGFGEENDLGERAKAAGWKIVAADDVYVWHEGKGSFAAEGMALERKHSVVLERLRPGYHADVAEFVRRNPLSEVQSVVERSIRRRAHDLAPAPLLVLHEDPFAEQPGGAAHSVRDLVRAMALPRVVLFYPGSDALEVLEVIEGELDRRLLYRFPVARLPDRFCQSHAETSLVFEEALSLFHIGWVHVHHLMFLPLTLTKSLHARGLPYMVTVHDFYWACPSFNLLDSRTATRCCPDSCGDAARTTACQESLFRALGEPLPDEPALFVDRHRALAREALGGARIVVFPSESARRIATTILGPTSNELRIVPHGYDAPAVRRRKQPEGTLRVGIVGQLAYPSKGAEAYLSVIERTEGEAVEWHLFGRTDLFEFERRLSERAPKARIVRHGSYDRDSIVPLLAETGVDVGLLMPAWPETFSYTLSELAGAGVPVVAARIGALADRLGGERWACLVDNAEQAASALRSLSADRERLREMTAAVRRPDGTRSWASAYAEMYRTCASASPVRATVASTVAEHERLNDVAVTRPVRSVGQPIVTEPAASVASSSWYRYAGRMSPYLPESIRHVARRLLSTNSSTAVLRFRLPGSRAKIGNDLSLDRRYLTTAKLTSHGADPHLFLEMEPLDPHGVDHVRFNLWCSTPRHAFAQLYWRHEGAVTFDEEHSIVIPLDGKMDAWQEYVVRFDGTRPCRAWYEGGSVVELRFDPINLPGPIGLGELVLGGPEPPS